LSVWNWKWEIEKEKNGGSLAVRLSQISTRGPVPPLPHPNPALPLSTPTPPIGLTEAPHTAPEWLTRGADHLCLYHAHFSLSPLSAHLISDPSGPVMPSHGHCLGLAHARIPVQRLAGGRLFADWPVGPPCRMHRLPASDSIAIPAALCAPIITIIQPRADRKLHTAYVGPGYRIKMPPTMRCRAWTGLPKLTPGILEPNPPSFQKYISNLLWASWLPNTQHSRRKKL
jgi:hypothetical protein